MIIADAANFKYRFSCEVSITVISFSPVGLKLYYFWSTENCLGSIIKQPVEAKSYFPWLYLVTTGFTVFSQVLERCCLSGSCFSIFSHLRCYFVHKFRYFFRYQHVTFMPLYFFSFMWCKNCSWRQLPLLRGFPL